MRVTPLVLGATLSACSLAVASAQPTATPTLPGDNGFGVRLSALHSSNIARSDAATAALRGVEREDWVFTPSVTAEVMRRLGRHAVFLTGVAGYDFHRNNSQLDHGRVNATGGAVISTPLCQIMPTGSFSLQQSDLTDITTVVVENQNKTIVGAATVSCGRKTGFSLVVSGYHQVVRNSAAIQKFNDHVSDGGQLAIGYAQPSLGNLGVLVGYSYNDFPARRVLQGPPGSHFVQKMIGVNYSKEIGRKLNISGTVARTMVDRSSTAPGINPKFSAWTYEGDVRYALSSRLSFALNGGRAVAPSDLPGGDVSVRTQGSAEVQYKLGSRLVLTAGDRIGTIKADNDTTLLGPVLTKQTLNSAYGSLKYARSRNQNVQLSFEHADRSTNIPALDFTDNRVILTLDSRF